MEVERFVDNESIKSCFKVFDHLWVLFENILNSDSLGVSGEFYSQAVVVDRGETVADETQDSIPIKIHEDNGVVCELSLVDIDPQEELAETDWEVFRHLFNLSQTINYEFGLIAIGIHFPSFVEVVFQSVVCLVGLVLDFEKNPFLPHNVVHFQTKIKHINHRLDSILNTK